MIAVEINSSITMTYLKLKTRAMHYRNLYKQYLIFLNNNGQRETTTVSNSNIFFYVKLVAIIILS